MHYTGYAAEKAKLEVASREKVIDTIESLYGWSAHEDGIAEDEVASATTERLRREALLQLDWDYTIPAGKEAMFTKAEE